MGEAATKETDVTIIIIMHMLSQNKIEKNHQLSLQYFQRELLGLCTTGLVPDIWALHDELSARALL